MPEGLWIYSLKSDFIYFMVNPLMHMKYKYNPPEFELWMIGTVFSEG